MLPRLPGKVPQPQRGPVGWGRASFDVLSYEISRHVQGLVEHREQTVPLTFEDLETSTRDELDLLFQQVDASERIAIAAEKQGRAADLRPVLRPELVGEAWSVQRIREEHETTEVRLNRSHAGDPSAE